jgi:hypothetical protein
MKNKTAHIIIISVSIIIFIGFFLFIINYLFDWNYSGSKFIKRILPAAVSSGKMISLYDFEKLAVINSKQDFSAFSTKNLIRDRLLKYRVADKFKCLKNYDFINQDYYFYEDTIKSISEDDLRNLGIDSKEDYVEYVIKPQIIEDCLRINYNLVNVGNSESYHEAQSILVRVLGNLSSFGEIAKNSSDDLESAVLEGDLGFIRKSDVVPEIWDAISVAKPGEIIPDIISSRLGYHILYLSEIGTKDEQKHYRVKQIQVNTSGFENWFSAQSKMYNVIFIK